MATAEMAGGGTSEEDILFEVQGLVSDSLAVVSYKWLSRKFSLPSNAAKRLLQTFAEKKENSELQVVYAISGWSKKEPQSYVIQLVPKPKLEDVRALLKDPPSVHVYSVQRSLPKDPAQLWSPDFVQTEQLFNESAESNNCLFDNRFSAVTCGLVQRLPTRLNSRVTSPPPPRLPVSSGSYKTSSLSTVPAPEAAPVPSAPVTSVPPKKSDATPKDDGKKPTKSSISPKTEQTEPKASSGPSTVGKRKTPSSTTGGSRGASGNSLASMWGKAPAKRAVSPPAVAVSVSVAEPPRTSALAGDAEAGIQALEAEDASEDDMVKEFTSMRRGQMPSGGGRRRRMIVDDGDDEDGAEGDDSETIIRLGTPESPVKGRPAAARDIPVKNEAPLQKSVQEKSPSPDRETLKAKGKLVKREPNVGSDLDSKTKANNRENVPEVKAQPATTSVPDLGRGGSKRKKVLKTRIDERGREVTEVIWEGEEKENVEKEKDQAAKQSASSFKQNDVKPPAVKPQAVQKPSMGPSKTAASKTNTKTSAKSAAGKPSKGQGNIMSFFRKA